jgi:hypothetical protein
VSNVSHVELTAHSLLLFLTYCIQIPNLDPTIYRFPAGEWYSQTTTVFSLRSSSTLILLRFPLSQVTWYYWSTLGSSLWHLVVSAYSIFSVCSGRLLCKITWFSLLMKLTSMMYIQCCWQCDKTEKSIEELVLLSCLLWQWHTKQWHQCLFD